MEIAIALLVLLYKWANKEMNSFCTYIPYLDDSVCHEATSGLTVTQHFTGISGRNTDTSSSTHTTSENTSYHKMWQSQIPSKPIYYLNPFGPVDQNKYLCKQCRSRCDGHNEPSHQYLHCLLLGSWLIFLFVTWVCSNSRKEKLQKLGAEKVNL